MASEDDGSSEVSAAEGTGDDDSDIAEILRLLEEKSDDDHGKVGDQEGDGGVQEVDSDSAVSFSDSVESTEEGAARMELLRDARAEGYDAGEHFAESSLSPIASEPSSSSESVREEGALTREHDVDSARTPSPLPHDGELVINPETEKSLDRDRNDTDASMRPPPRRRRKHPSSSSKLPPLPPRQTGLKVGSGPERNRDGYRHPESDVVYRSSSSVTTQRSHEELSDDDILDYLRQKYGEPATGHRAPAAVAGPDSTLMISEERFTQLLERYFQGIQEPPRRRHVDDDAGVHARSAPARPRTPPRSPVATGPAARSQKHDPVLDALIVRREALRTQIQDVEAALAHIRSLRR